MPIRAVAYISEAGPAVAGDPLGLRCGKLDDLVDDAARFNRNAGVTGVLLFDGARFLQYMEGPEDGLNVAYSRVLGAASHTGLIELQRGRVGNRRLPFWPMRWLPTQPEQLKSLARADWSGFAQRTGDDVPTETAMDVLARLVEPHAVAA
ncbi:MULTISPECIES: BLUF domain-containing protein [unclassified Stenotrophomonas]|uniref:BLUF domain-containing protein n=1 Tax=unclassified Stenotrophomonas TaxID=196198 RepID=UPI001F53C53F|nr:BLUF domain-containing protein [Stenotrophomonas maltophilia]MCU1180476.1 BLUF domain-containing protein [Stenotrophomonas maltophilia]